MKHYLGPKEGQDCRFWSERERESKGHVDGHCDCPHTKYHKYRDLLVMYENEKIELKDMWASDWVIVQQLIIQREIHKREVADATERMARLAGKTPGASKGKFPTLR